MIYKKEGDVVAIRGNVFTVGAKIICKPDCEYSGLTGKIAEIHTKEDEDTTILCNLDAPKTKFALQMFKNRYEAQFGAVDDEIEFSNVSLSPDNITVLKDPVVVKYLVSLTQDWFSGGKRENQVVCDTKKQALALIKSYQAIDKEGVKNGTFSIVGDTYTASGTVLGKDGKELPYRVIATIEEISAMLDADGVQRAKTMALDKVIEDEVLGIADTMFASGEFDEFAVSKIFKNIKQIVKAIKLSTIVNPSAMQLKNELISNALRGFIENND